MNFFTRPFTTEEMDKITCNGYYPNKFSDESETFTMLDLFLKLKYKNKVADPYFFIRAMFFNPSGWEEGLELIKKPLEDFLKSKNKMPQDYVVDFSTFQKKQEVFNMVADDFYFVRNDLRLHLIQVIENS